MKKRHGVFFGFAVLLVTALFTMAGCGDPEGGPTGGGGNGETNPLITGKFASQRGTGEAVFYADYASSARSISRAVAGMSDTEKELTGKIEDGDIIFNLSGVYDTASDSFFLSAGSSFLIFEIAGTMSDGGTMSATEAVVKVEDDGEWTIHSVPVTAASDTTITGNASTEQADGIPSAWLGRWTSGVAGDYILTPYQITSPTGEVFGGLMNITGTGISRTMVWSTVSVSTGEDEQGNPTREVTTTFNKITLEETGTYLTFKAFGNRNGYATLAEAQAVPTDAPVFSLELTR